MRLHGIHDPNHTVDRAACVYARADPPMPNSLSPKRIFHDGVPNGETAEDVAARVRRVIDRAAAVPGDVVLFSHGHALRVLAAVWLRLAPEDGERFYLETGTISILGFERDMRVIRMWNGRV